MALSARVILSKYLIKLNLMEICQLRIDLWYSVNTVQRSFERILHP